MQPNASKIAFVLALGESPAYDTVCPTPSLSLFGRTSPIIGQAIFSTDKAALIDGAQFESRQRFEDPTTLGEFRYLLEVIREELVAYQIWPVSGHQR